MPPCGMVSELAMSLASFLGVLFHVLLHSTPPYVQRCVSDLSPPEAKEEESTFATFASLVGLDGGEDIAGVVL
eukprot:8310227-Ditylum_brightwellii.AAC.1